MKCKACNDTGLIEVQSGIMSEYGFAVNHKYVCKACIPKYDCEACCDTGMIRTPSDKLIEIENQGGHGIEEPKVCKCQYGKDIVVRPPLDEIMKYIIDNNHSHFGRILHFLTTEGKDDMIEAIHYYRNGEPDLNLPELEVSDREPCGMCAGKGSVILTPGKGTPYRVACDWCGGCGKMGPSATSEPPEEIKKWIDEVIKPDPPEEVIERWGAIKKWLGGT